LIDTNRRQAEDRASVHHLVLVMMIMMILLCLFLFVLESSCAVVVLFDKEMASIIPTSMPIIANLPYHHTEIADQM
jgi:hypothetical protein